MGKRLEDLTVSDEPLVPRDLFALARQIAADMKQMAARDKAVIALYRAPDYLRWGVETLSEEATGGVQEPAATCLLEVGLSTIRRFDGVTEICAARTSVLPHGDAETMHWFGDFPIVNVSAMGTDDRRPFRLHVPIALAKQFAKLARSLGLPVSRLGTFALMTGLLHAPSCSAQKYSKAMVRTLQELRAVLERRGAEAQVRAAGAAATPNANRNQRWTIADVVGPWASSEPDDDY